MPSFTPHKSVKSPVLRFRRSPNVFLLKDETIVEGGCPHEDTISKAFLFGHEPSGVSDGEAKLLIDYGFSLIPDGVMWHKFDAPSLGSSFGLTVGVNDGLFARGVSNYHGASATFTVFREDTKIVSRSVPWFPKDKYLKFSYVLGEAVSHRVEVVLSNNTFSLEPYVAVWEK